MKKWQKRLILAVVVLAIAATSAIFIFHDDSDLEAIEKKQVESIDEVTTQDNFDVIGEDLENFESTQDSI